MARIAVVEDEASLRADLVEYLGACGHQAVGCEDGVALDRALALQSVDIIILDVNLPGESGFSIAGRLRKQSRVGIVMLTARGLSVDRVVGLELGADVYLVKPVELREMEAQVRSLARRVEIAASLPQATGWIYDHLAWALVSPDGIQVKLTTNERAFVALLVARPGEAVSRDEVMRALGKRAWDPTDRSVDSMVRRLRAKGETLTGAMLPVEAVHGTGYTFTAPIFRVGE